MSERRLLLLLLGGLAALAAIAAAVALLAAPGERGGTSSSPSPTAAPDGETTNASGFAGAVLPAGVRAREFTLTDALAPRPRPEGARPGGARLDGDGRVPGRVSLADFRGQVVVLAFLYSTCGPTCVLIAQQIRGALDELPRPVPVLIVSANPTADTPSRVRRFLAQVSLTGRVRYLTGALAQLRSVWHAYGAIPASAGRGAFNRSATVLLIDRTGHEHVAFGVEQLTPDGLAHDIGLLRDGRATAGR